MIFFFTKQTLVIILLNIEFQKLKNTFVFPFQMVLFVGYLCFSASQIHKIEIGLDQKLSMPDVSIS